MKRELPYVTSQFGLPILSQPYLFTDSDLAVFGLESDATRLNQLLDQSINIPSQGHFDYRALGLGNNRLVFLVMAQMTIGARKRPDEIYGSERYSELSFWIPCYDRKQLFNFKLFLPLLFPDSLSAIATGREMFGFAKQLGSYSFPAGSLDLENPVFSASSVQFREIGPGNSAESLVFLSVEDAEDDQREAAICFGDLQEAGQVLTEQVLSDGTKCTDAETGEEVGDIAIDLDIAMPAIFLKQFPSVTNSQISESRSIATAPFVLRRITGGCLLPQSFDLDFPRLASLPIVSELGLVVKSSERGVDTVAPAFSLSLKIEFELQTGETLLTVMP